jgi:hypothetical protein
MKLKYQQPRELNCNFLGRKEKSKGEKKRCTETNYTTNTDTRHSTSKRT